MFFRNIFNKGYKGNGGDRSASSPKTPRDLKHVALLQVSSAVKGQKHIATVFEIIGREAVRSLRASRATVFLVDETKGGLKTQFMYSPNPADEKVGLLEEKEISRRTIAEKRPVLLREPKDFAEFFKYEERERKITAFMSIPFGIQGRLTGTLSLSIINGKRPFSQSDLEFLAIFSNCASIAMLNQNLLEQVRKASGLQKNYEQHLDDLMGQLQSLSGEERRRIDNHIATFLSGFKGEKREVKHLAAPAEGGNGALRLAGEVTFEDTPELTEKVQVEIENKARRGDADLSQAAIFIPTANPRDLGEQFLLKLYPAEGQPLELPCKVIFSNKYGKESQNLRRGMEIKFLDLPPELEKQVGDYLHSLESPKSGEGAESSPSIH
ncbi:MAG: GAF domain-containing protein [Planctomycetaceae bacterium]